MTIKTVSDVDAQVSGGYDIIVQEQLWEPDAKEDTASQKPNAVLSENTTAELRNPGAGSDPCVTSAFNPCIRWFLFWGVMGT